MTAKQLFEYALIELNKREAPSLLLEDYNYFINKAINQYINKVYNAYDVDQQRTDDLRVLKSTAILTPSINNDYRNSSLFDKIYEVDLPDDYLHILNCVVEYDVLRNFKCYNSGSKWHQGAFRLTSDMYSQIINNYYLRPTYRRPYYFINNVNIVNTYPNSTTSTNLPIEKFDLNIVAKEWSTYSLGDIIKKDTYIKITDSGQTERIFYQCIEDHPKESIFDTEESKYIMIGGSNKSLISDPWEQFLYGAPLIEKEPETRYGNRSKVRMELRYGKDDAVFKLSSVYIDYLKSPQFIRLTQDQVDEVQDNSQLLEFPDYVAQEIVNELIRLLMENSSDPRLQSHIPINTSISQPAAQQGQQRQ